MEIKVKRADAIWSYIGTILSMGANLIVLPFILYFLSDDAVALYYVFSSVSGIGTLFDFGFSPAMARNIAYAWSGAESIKEFGVDKSTRTSPNYMLIKKLIKACKIIYWSISLVALFVLCVFGTAYIEYIIRNCRETEYIVAWFIYVVAVFLNLLYNYYSVFLRGVGAIAKVNIVTIVARILQIVLTIVLLALGIGLIGVSIAYLVYGLVFRILSKVEFYKYCAIGDELTKLKIDIEKQEILHLLIAMWPNVWRDGMVTLSGFFLNQATTIVSSIYFTLQQTGIYSLCAQLTTAVAMVAGTMYTTFQPALQSAYANRDVNSQRKSMSVIMFTYILIFTVGMIGLSTVGVPLVKLIKPSYVIDFPMLFLVGAYQFLLKYRNCYTSYISTTNRVIYWKAFIFSAFVCVVLSFLLSETGLFGIYGLAIAQLISQLMYNAWYWPRMVHRELDMKFKDIITIGGTEVFYMVLKKNVK